MHPRLGLLAAALLLAAAPHPSAAQLLFPNPQITAFSFSPNGDGIQDSTVITYELSDSATVDIVVYESDSVTLVNTLVDGVVHEPDSAFTVSWRGTTGGGAAVPDGPYVIFVRAHSATEADSAYFRVFVDVVYPQVNVTNINPAVFAPRVQASPLTVDYTLADPPPSDTVSVRIDVFDPRGALAAVVEDSLFPANGSQRAEWDGATIGTRQDGLHELRITVTDKAGNWALAYWAINVDDDGPDFSLTDAKYRPQLVVWEGTYRADQDTIVGWAWDRNGVASIEFQHPDSAAFAPVPRTVPRNDTLYFNVFPLTNALNEDSTVTFKFRARDAAGITRTDSLHALL